LVGEKRQSFQVKMAVEKMGFFEREAKESV